jgi:propionyl-CoA synthetase
MTCASSTTMVTSRPAGEIGAHHASSCRCRRAACRPCGTPTTASVESYLSAFPGYYLTGDAGLQGRGRLPLHHERAPTTSSTSPATASPPAAWRRCWPPTRTSPNAPSSASPTPSRARCRWAWWSSRAASRSPRTRSSRAGGPGAREDRPGGGLQEGHRGRALPKTRSGKILRGTMKRIADGQAFNMPATIDDPAILDEITAKLRTIGYAHQA